MKQTAKQIGRSCRVFGAICGGGDGRPVVRRDDEADVLPDEAERGADGYGRSWRESGAGSVCYTQMSVVDQGDDWGKTGRRMVQMRSKL